jgi:hypothetical protein
MAGGDDQSRFEQDWHLLWSYHQIHDPWLSTCAKTLASEISPFVNASKPKHLLKLLPLGAVQRIITLGVRFPSRAQRLQGACMAIVISNIADWLTN